jgi:hypothetical protein
MLLRTRLLWPALPLALLAGACGDGPESGSALGVAGAGVGGGASVGGAKAGAASAGSAGKASALGGSGGGNAGGGSGGTDGKSMLTLKQPIERGDQLVLEFGQTFFEVTPGHGARVTSLRHAGQELLKLSGAPNFEDALGSTFWPSPQSWPWPPPAEIDTLAYSASIDAQGSLTLASQPHIDTGLKVEKRFSADLSREALVLEYAMTNIDSEPRQWAPWEITRMPAQGLAFWPSAGTPFGENPLAYHEALGHTWCQPADTEGEAKLFADAAGGYLAYATAGSILIKQFEDLPKSAAAPGEAEVEIYVNADHSYVEVENQGAYASIEPGGTVRWRVTWYARRLPAGVTASVGNADLIAFVTQTLQ